MTYEEAFEFYTGVIGVPIKEYYESTPKELELKAKGIMERRKQEAEWQSYGVSVGVVNALSKKKVKLFDSQKSVSQVTDDEKQEALNDLVQRLHHQ